MYWAESLTSTPVLLLLFAIVGDRLVRWDMSLDWWESIPIGDPDDCMYTDRRFGSLVVMWFLVMSLMARSSLGDAMLGVVGLEAEKDMSPPPTLPALEV